MAIYPAQYETTAVLRDGSSLVLGGPSAPMMPAPCSPSMLGSLH